MRDTAAHVKSKGKTLFSDVSGFDAAHTSDTYKMYLAVDKACA